MGIGILELGSGQSSRLRGIAQNVKRIFVNLEMISMSSDMTRPSEVTTPLPSLSVERIEPKT